MNTSTAFNVHAGTSCIAWTAMTVPSTPPWASMCMLILNHRVMRSAMPIEAMSPIHMSRYTNGMYSAGLSTSSAYVMMK